MTSDAPTEVTTQVLPAPREPGSYAVALVCLGNICRSPMADVVLTARVAEAGLADCVRVASCGTGGWHVGKPMDPRSAEVLSERGYDPTRHRARQFDANWLEDHDLVLAMDHENLAEIQLVAGSAEHVRLFRDFDPQDPGEPVPDPYYGGPSGFEEVLGMVERVSATLAPAIAAALGREATR